MIYALYAYAYVALFFGLFVLVMGVYRAHLTKRLKWWHWVLLWWAVLIGYVVDVLSNVFIATFVFWDPPKEWLVTDRLIRYKNDPKATTYQYTVAVFVCDELLDIFDPTGEHC
jgi:hypothetical protein